MIDQKQKDGVTPATGFSEAERMAKVRELLIGPAIADESARVDESIVRLDELVREQQEVISALQARIQELEAGQRTGMRRLQVRLLGMVEALIADEDDVRARLLQHETLLSELKIDKENGGA